MSSAAATDEALEQRKAYAQALLRRSGFETAEVVEVVVEGYEFPVILFTVDSPVPGKRVAFTAWMRTPLSAPKPRFNPEPNWDT